jgi:hypothetical protein
MAKRKYAAYAGNLRIASGVIVTIEYLNANEASNVFGWQPPGIKGRKGAGWYWRLPDAGPMCGHRGPFSSSRRAWRDAEITFPLKGENR